MSLLSIADNSSHSLCIPCCTLHEMKINWFILVWTAAHSQAKQEILRELKSFYRLPLSKLLHQPLLFFFESEKFCLLNFFLCQRENDANACFAILTNEFFHYIKHFSLRLNFNESERKTFINVQRSAFSACNESDGKIFTRRALCGSRFPLWFN